MRNNTVFGLALALALAVLAITAAGGNANTRSKEYVVLYAEGASLPAAHGACTAIGGQIVSENTAVGVATVRTANAHFMSDVMTQSALSGAARNEPVGYEAPLGRADKGALERLTAAQKATAGREAPNGQEG